MSYEAWKCLQEKNAWGTWHFFHTQPLAGFPWGICLFAYFDPGPGPRPKKAPGLGPNIFKKTCPRRKSLQRLCLDKCNVPHALFLLAFPCFLRQVSIPIILFSKNWEDDRPRGGHENLLSDHPQNTIKVARRNYQTHKTNYWKQSENF